VCSASREETYEGDGGGLRDLPERLPTAEPPPPPPEAGADDFVLDWKSEIDSLASNLSKERGEGDSDLVDQGPERVYLVGVSVKSRQKKYGYSIQESLEELGRLAETAGLEVAGSTYQKMDSPSSRTYIGSGKLLEIADAVKDLGCQTVIFDDELSPGQQRSLEKVLGEDVRLADRTALILDIFGQRAATREGQLQVELAMSEYQLPRLTRMWSHLERQGGGRSKGMGEKQIEVDKRILRNRMALLRKELEEVRKHRKQQRVRRSQGMVPVVGLCGYTNSGKSTLLNRMTQSQSVWAEDTLFATLDPTTRKIELTSGKQALLTDTVGFIQKLPTQLVAAFRATLEEIGDASLLLHVVDVSSPNAAAQTDTVCSILEELDIHLPIVTVWNKVDLCADPEFVRQVAAGRETTVCISALTGEGLEDLAAVLETQLAGQMTLQRWLVPYSQGEVVAELHQQASIVSETYVQDGTLITAFCPPSLAMRLRSLGLTASDATVAAAGAPVGAQSDSDGELLGV